MKVLLVGSGGREHALAWKRGAVAASGAVYLSRPATPARPAWCPGPVNLAIAATDVAGAWSRFAVGDAGRPGGRRPGGRPGRRAGDALRAAGLRSSALRRRPGSRPPKPSPKPFMARPWHPHGALRRLTEFETGAGDSGSAGLPGRHQGLRAGGRQRCARCRKTQPRRRRPAPVMLAHEFGAAGDEVVIEERLNGPEVSLLAFATASRCARCRRPRTTNACWMATAGRTPAAWAPMPPPRLPARDGG